MVDTRRASEDGPVLHLLEPGAPLPEVGATVALAIDWERRYRFMRYHTLLHLLGAVVKAPIVEVLRRNGREVALTALLRTSQQVTFYIFTTYIITYATTVLGFGRGLVLNMVMAMAIVSCFANPLFEVLRLIWVRLSQL